MSESENEEDMLYYSHHKLFSMIKESGNKSTSFKKYLENLKFPPIKDFTQGLEWFNVSEPLSFAKHLKGKIVVLDFFTYCCINCMHIIPDLKEVEKEHSVEDGLVVIGVHSAKFQNEKTSANILSAVQRYNLTHPVVNDYKHEMWKNCDVQCWPTLLILGPNANPIAMLMGEGHKQNLKTFVSGSLEYYKAKGQISDHPLPFKSAYHLLPNLKGPLLFPGKIVNFVKSNKEEILAVSDTGNNRVLILKSDGTILHQAGSGRLGFRDGTLTNSEFNSPQGVVFRNEDTVYVADTNNHAIRKIDLKNNKVETIAGTGVQGRDRAGGEKASLQKIASPWDICIYRTPDMDMTFYPDGNPPVRDILLIAMAGLHQIWALFLEDTVWWKCKKYSAGSLSAIAGSGAEENRSNLYPSHAAFAQPSGLTICYKNKELYIADSESSTVRRLSLADGKVTLVVGGEKDPGNLFAFGDKDGTLCQARLQHLLGLTMANDDETLLVADTYNHKLKRVNITQNSITTISTPSADTTDGKETQFNEPSGLCFSADGKKLYVTDTNNHCIKVVKMGPDFSIKSISKLTLNLVDNILSEDQLKYQVLNGQTVAVHTQGGKIIFNVEIMFDGGLELTQDAPQKWLVKLPDVTWSCVPASGDNLKHIDVVVSVPAGKGGDVDFAFDLITCTTEVCLPKTFIVRIPIQRNNNSSTNVETNVKIVLDPNNILVK